MHDTRGRSHAVLALLIVGALGGAAFLLRAPSQFSAPAPPLEETPGAGPVSPSLRRPGEATGRAEAAARQTTTRPHEEQELPPEEQEDDLLADPVQLGPAALDLRLVDARSGEGVASQVELWRIDAPGNEHWTEGDQLQEQAHVPVEGHYFTRLPEGRYRLVCHAQAWDASPPEITVTAPRTRLDVPIEVPQRFRLRAVVRDRFGRLVPKVSFGQERMERLTLSEPWRFERTLRSGEVIWTDEESSPEMSLRSSEGPQLPEGFDLGLHGGATRGAPKVPVFVLETPEGARVRVRVPVRADGDVELVAVALPPDELTGRILFPGGAPARPDLDVVGEAVQREPGLPGGGWERAPVRIGVRLAGYEPVDELWTVASGELPWIELVPGR